MQALYLLIALAALLTGLAQSVRTRTCSLERKPQPIKIITWLTCGASATLALAPSLLLTLPVLLLALIGASITVTLLTRLLWKLGV